MKTKEYFEDLYKTNYDLAIDAMKQNDLNNAKAYLQKAGEALIRITGMTSGAEREKYILKIKPITNVLRKLEGKEPLADPPPKEPPKAEPIPSIEEVLSDLDSVVGHDEVKEWVRTYIKTLMMAKARKEAGLPPTEMCHNLVLIGNPGTGKTTVARILAKAFCALGICERPGIVESSRFNFVAGYVGQTAIRTRKFLEENKNGVLVIDDVHQMSSQYPADFGHEALDEIYRHMQNNVNSPIIILEGYPEPTEGFLNANPRFSTMFRNVISFRDYTAEEMTELFFLFAKKYAYELTDAAREKVSLCISEIVSNAERKHANARTVKTLFVKTYENQIKRLSGLGVYTQNELCKIEQEDIPSDPEMFI